MAIEESMPVSTDLGQGVVYQIIERRPMLYVIGSLRNNQIPVIAETIRTEVPRLEIFDDWWSASEDADDWWQRHERYKGRTYHEAINGYHARHVFEFDYHHLNRSDGGILVLPAGKSGHLEFGYLMGQKKNGYILLDGEPERYDVMYRFSSKGVFTSLEDLLEQLKKDYK